MSLPCVAVATGDPAGIGPELEYGRLGQALHLSDAGPRPRIPLLLEQEWFSVGSPYRPLGLGLLGVPRTSAAKCSGSATNENILEAVREHHGLSVVAS